MQLAILKCWRCWRSWQGCQDDQDRQEIHLIGVGGLALAEAKPPFLERDESLMPDDQVIEHVNAQQFARRDYVLRDRYIFW